MNKYFDYDSPIINDFMMSFSNSQYKLINLNKLL